MKTHIDTPKAPGAIGPHSQAVKRNGLIFVSGQLPINPTDGTMGECIKCQTRQSLENAKAILEAAGASFDDVVKTTVFLADMSLFGEMNEVYAEYFSAPYPARCAFAVKEVPRKALVEIEMIAAV